MRPAATHRHAPAATVAVALIALAPLGLLPCRPVAADTPLELSKVMTGTWKGQIQRAGRVPGGPGRTLIIKSVRWQEGQWAVEAEFGVTGKPLGRIEPVAEVVRDDVALEFVSPAGVLVRLKLVRSERTWVGTAQFRGVATPVDIRLEKVSD